MVSLSNHFQIAQVFDKLRLTITCYGEPVEPQSKRTGLQQAQTDTSNLSGELYTVMVSLSNH
jgi:hypothetical protein